MPASIVISVVLSVILTAISNLIIQSGLPPDDRIGSITGRLSEQRRQQPLPGRPSSTEHRGGSSPGSKAGTPPDGIIAGLDMRNPRRIGGSLYADTDNPNTDTVKGWKPESSR